MEEETINEVSNAVSRVQLASNGQGEISYQEAGMSIESEDSTLGLPNILIVTNIPECVFNHEDDKEEFERLFKQFGQEISFQYLKSFRRTRVVFDTPLMAARARVHLHETLIHGQNIKCFFAQIADSTEDNSSPHLLPPKPEKQFLISPPASPPVGWEPIEEAEPCVNYDLLSALAGLAPGEAHELHPPSNEHPGIVVHVCEDPQGYGERPSKIAQTKRPNMT